MRFTIINNKKGEAVGDANTIDDTRAQLRKLMQTSARPQDLTVNDDKELKTIAALDWLKNNQ